VKSDLGIEDLEVACWSARSISPKQTTLAENPMAVGRGRTLTLKWGTEGVKNPDAFAIYKKKKKKVYVWNSNKRICVIKCVEIMGL